MKALTIALEASQNVTIKLIDDSGKVQLAQFEVDAPGDDEDGGEDIVEAETMLPYGLSANPPDGSEGIVLALGGDGGNAVVITMQHRDQRPTGLAKGEVCLHMGADIKVHLKADGKVYLGSSDATDYVALASKVEAELGKIKAAISGAAVVASDGGAAFKANIIAALNSSGMGASGSTAATTVLAE